MGRRSAHPHPLLQDQMGTGGEGERPNGGSAEGGLGRREALRQSPEAAAAAHLHPK